MGNCMNSKPDFSKTKKKLSRKEIESKRLTASHTKLEDVYIL